MNKALLSGAHFSSLQRDGIRQLPGISPSRRIPQSARVFREHKVAPRIKFLFVLDRSLISVRDFFYPEEFLL